jgi:hypothetical protein
MYLLLRFEQISNIQNIIKDVAITKAIKKHTGSVTNSQGIVITLNTFNMAKITEASVANELRTIYSPRKEVLFICLLLFFVYIVLHGTNTNIIRRLRY